MKKYLKILLALFSVLLCGFAVLFSFYLQDTHKNQNTSTIEQSLNQPLIMPRDELTIRKLDGEEIKFDIEIAKTPEQLSTGMMYRKDVPEKTGMIFLFDKEQRLSFWMKNVEVPLDMIFIEKNGIIHNIHSMAKPQDTTSILSNGDVFAVLELGGGEAERLGIEVGDSVIYKDQFTGVTGAETPSAN